MSLKLGGKSHAWGNMYSPFPSFWSLSCIIALVSREVDAVAAPLAHHDIASTWRQRLRICGHGLRYWRAGAALGTSATRARAYLPSKANQQPDGEELLWLTALHSHCPNDSSQVAGGRAPRRYVARLGSDLDLI